MRCRCWWAGRRSPARCRWAPVVLFAVIFMWTPPHFWALAVRYRDDYEAANVPMLPVVASLARIAREILALHGRAGRPSPLAVRRGRPHGRASTLRGRACSGAVYIGWRPGCGVLAPATGPIAARCHAAVRVLDHLSDVLFVAMAVDVLVRVIR